MTYTVLNSQYQSSINHGDLDDSDFLKPRTESQNFSDIKTEELEDDDMETRIWAQFVRERQNRTTEGYVKKAGITSDATNSKSTYTSSTKAAKAEQLLKKGADSDTFSAFDAQQSISGKSANAAPVTNKRALSYNNNGVKPRMGSPK